MVPAAEVVTPAMQDMPAVPPLSYMQLHSLAVRSRAKPSVHLSLQPVTQVVTPSEYATGYTSVTTKFDTGREQFTAFYPCAAFASDCILTAHLYYAWGMHGILPGARDSLFSVQVRCSTSFHSLNERPIDSCAGPTSL
jgi:hypothetical protein